ncbi:MAG: nucleoside hydrolase [Propionibacteriaceae bacterium]
MIGPLTNLALALRRDHHVAHVVAMGGYFGSDPGRTEHNIGSDVAAAAAVAGSGVQLTMIGLEQTTRIRLGPTGSSPTSPSTGWSRSRWSGWSPPRPVADDSTSRTVARAAAEATGAD